MSDPPPVEITFAAVVIQWAGRHLSSSRRCPRNMRTRSAARTASCGGVPVNVAPGDITFATSLFPRDGGYLAPIRDAVREKTGAAPGEITQLTLSVTARRAGAQAPAAIIGANFAAVRLAPPTSAPSTSRAWSSAAAFSAVTDPP